MSLAHSFPALCSNCIVNDAGRRKDNDEIVEEESGEVAVYVCGGDDVKQS